MEIEGGPDILLNRSRTFLPCRGSLGLLDGVSSGRLMESGRRKLRRQKASAPTRISSISSTTSRMRLGLDCTSGEAITPGLCLESDVAWQHRKPPIDSGDDADGASGIDSRLGWTSTGPGAARAVFTRVLLTEGFYPGIFVS